MRRLIPALLLLLAVQAHAKWALVAADGSIKYEHIDVPGNYAPLPAGFSVVEVTTVEYDPNDQYRPVHYIPLLKLATYDLPRAQALRTDSVAKAADQDKLRTGLSAALTDLDQIRKAPSFTNAQRDAALRRLADVLYRLVRLQARQIEGAQVPPEVP